MIIINAVLFKMNFYLEVVFCRMSDNNLIFQEFVDLGFVVIKVFTCIGTDKIMCTHIYL